MKKDLSVFVSIPKYDLPEEEIVAAMNKVFDEFVDFVNKTEPIFKYYNFSLIDYVTNMPGPPQPMSDMATVLWHLGSAIQLLGTADVVIFANRYVNAPDCYVEHMVVRECNIPTYYERSGMDEKFDGPYVWSGKHNAFSRSDGVTLSYILSKEEKDEERS